MPDLISKIASDNFRLAKSKTLVSLADGTYNIIQIPRYAFISQIWLVVTTAYAGGADGAATIGFTGNGETADADGFMDAAAADGRALGVKIMTDDAQPGSKGKWFNAAGGMLTITLDDGSDTTLMSGYVLMQYSVIH
jgi:hypothetical protein